MLKKAEDEVLSALVAALTRAYDGGSSVAGQSLEQRRRIAVAALRAAADIIDDREATRQLDAIAYELEAQ